MLLSHREPPKSVFISLFLSQVDSSGISGNNGCFTFGAPRFCWFVSAAAQQSRDGGTSSALETASQLKGRELDCLGSGKWETCMWSPNNNEYGINIYIYICEYNMSMCSKSSDKASPISSEMVGINHPPNRSLFPNPELQVQSQYQGISRAGSNQVRRSLYFPMIYA